MMRNATYLCLQMSFRGGYNCLIDKQLPHPLYNLTNDITISQPIAPAMSRFGVSMGVIYSIK